MESNKYEILKKRINVTSLVSLTSKNWIDSFGQLIPWTNNDVYIGPNTGDIIFNLSGGTVTTGYYKWDTPIVNRWNLIEPAPIKLITETDKDYLNRVNSKNFDNFNLPIYLESSVDEMGVMVGFDGEVQQVDQLVNFSYSGVTGTKTVHVYSTTNPDKLRKIVEQVYVLNWGDGSPTETLTINNGIPNTNLPKLSHTYGSLTSKSTISITFNSPWGSQIVSKKISLPFLDPTIISNPLGSFSGITMPIQIDYINDLDNSTNPTGPATIKYMGIGQSRIDELRKYGETTYNGITTGTTDGSNWSGYTLDNLYYQDFEDGYTMISGSTSTFTKEEVINRMITRNEHFIGFIDEPTIYSDIFVERGKQGVMEKNLRLGEIDNIGEVGIYGNGYFNVRKQ
jgi:hypothetical protein